MGEKYLGQLTAKSAPATGDILVLEDSEDTKKIDYDALANAILNKLTTKTYTVAGGSNTLIAAIDALNSNNYTDQGNGNSLLNFVATLAKGTYNFRLDNAPEAPVTGGVTYTIKKTHPVNDTRCSIIATPMDSSNPDVFSAFVGQNATSITWKKAAKQSDVDTLKNALIKDYGPIGNNKNYVESFEYLANQLPAGVPIMGTYNSSGAKVFWGYLYNERNYGMFEVINYTGNRAIVILDNGTWKTV